MIEYLKLPDTTIQHMISHAEEVFPYECCGVVVNDQYIKFNNDSTEPDETFVINNLQFYKYYEQGKIQYLVHSHNNKDYASVIDQQKADDLELPSIIINVRDGKFAELFYLRVPTPILGRPFHFGVWDCLQLVYDFYNDKYKVKLPNPPRDISFLYNNRKLFEEYLQDLTQFEVVEIDNLQEDDILFYCAGGRIIHVGIYLNEDKCLHHWFNQRSGYFPLDYKKHSLRFAMRLKNGN